MKKKENVMFTTLRGLLLLAVISASLAFGAAAASAHDGARPDRADRADRGERSGQVEREQQGEWAGRTVPLRLGGPVTAANISWE